MHYAPPRNDPTKAYRRNTILTASPGKLIVLLYEGAIRHMERARIEIETPGRERTSAAGMALSKSMAIVGELRSCLDQDKGMDSSQELDQLYEFILDRVYQTNIERKPGIIDPAITVMKTLKEGWDAVVPE